MYIKVCRLLKGSRSAYNSKDKTVKCPIQLSSYKSNNHNGIEMHISVPRHIPTHHTQPSDNNNKPNSVIIQPQLLPHKPPSFGSVGSAFPFCADALERVEEHACVEEAVWFAVSDLIVSPKMYKESRKISNLHPPIPSSSTSPLSVVGVSAPRLIWPGSPRTIRPRRWWFSPC